MMSKTGIVLLNYRQENLTLQCLHALQLQSCQDFEITVMDNSPEGKGISTDRIRQISPAIRFWRLHENRGFAAGNNPAVQDYFERGFDYIWLLNNDTVPAENALEAAVRFMENHLEIGIAGMKILSMKDRSLQCVGGGIIHPMKIYIKPALHLSDTCEWISGCSMFIRRNVIERIGLLDEDFFMYFEDVDFCMRARNAGFRIGVVPQTEILHAGGASVPSISAEKYSFFSAVHYAEKNSAHPWRSYFWIVETRLIAPFLKGDICKTLQLLCLLLKH